MGGTVVRRLNRASEGRNSIRSSSASRSSCRTVFHRMSGSMGSITSASRSSCRHRCLRSTRPRPRLWPIRSSCQTVACQARDRGGRAGRHGDQLLQEQYSDRPAAGDQARPDAQLHFGRASSRYTPPARTGEVEPPAFKLADDQPMRLELRAVRFRRAMKQRPKLSCCTRLRCPDTTGGNLSSRPSCTRAIRSFSTMQNAPSTAISGDKPAYEQMLRAKFKANRDHRRVAGCETG